MWRSEFFQRIAPALRVVLVLAILVGINLFIREGGFAIRDLNSANDPLYYAQQEGDREGPRAPVTLTASVDRGDTLAKVLRKAQVARADAFAAIDALRKVFNPKDLKMGQEIELTFQPGEDADSPATFMGFWFEPSVDRQISVMRGDDGRFRATEIRRPTTKQLVKSTGTIDNSLFSDAVAAGIPAQVIIEAIRAFSFDVDFQREIQPSDKFEVAFERYATDQGQTARVGDLIYARLTLGNKDLKIYRYLPRDGVIDYFNGNGESVRKALLRTPVDGARITSKFTAARKHPILGFTRAHKGVDFGVPQGTPIMAAGAGVVVESGFNNGYGNYVRIRHNPTYSTMYAHMSRIGRGISKGARVSQGQTIGFVGMTGLATGPHLHYEVLVNNAQVNPLGVKLISGQKLRGADLAAFEKAKASLDSKLGTMPNATLARD
ncbi:MAG: peptidoglycan DD-metalloendopeptidase family protein [Gemmatimonas sp.]